MKMKVFHVGGMLEYSNWLPNVEIVDSVKEADLVVFEGGVDVGPSVYGDKRGSYTDKPNVARDEREIEFFGEAVALGKKLLGICRGSQLICALAGGRLVQHQDNPLYIHEIKTFDGKEVKISSTHHQAQYPFELPESEYKILGWTEGLSAFHLDGDDKELNPKKEVEIAYYPKIKALAIQGHPEYTDYQRKNPESLQWFKDLFNKFYNGKL